MKNAFQKAVSLYTFRILTLWGRGRGGGKAGAWREAEVEIVIST